MSNAAEYHVRLRSLAEREAKIRASVAANKDTRDFYDFRNQLIKLPLIRLPQDYLIYRMENFRTYIDQHEYAVRERKPSDFFTTGQENETAQNLQHQFLAKLARQGRADSVTPVIDVLRIEKQREPLIITHRGVVVNGNRRLAAIRELLAESPTEFSDLAYVDCLVLPADATASEIVDIEAALQAKPETRLDYDWIGDCQLIQRMLNLGRNVEQVAQRLNRKVIEVSNALSALMEADLYLKEWAHAEGEYRRVVDAEQLFKDLPGLLQNKDPSLADASRVIAWNLLDNKSKLGGRLYSYNSAIGKHAEQVLNRVAESLNLPTDKADADDDEAFAVDVAGGSPARTFQPVIAALRDRNTKDEAVDALVDVCKDVIEEDRSKRGANAALKAVTAAYAKLMDVNLGAAEASTYDAIDKQLDQIATRAAGMKSVLAKLRNPASN
jgi:hypothetical protein